jgi:membrane-associated phospholipid phosphatase
MLAPSRWVVIAAALAFLLLAVAAAVDGQSLLLHVDRPVEEFVVSHRHPVLDQLFRVLTHLGASALVVPAAAAVAALVWRRCSALALSILAAVAVRPVFEIGCKLVVARSRPELDPLVDVASASFPSGHVFTAVAVWGLLPTVAGVLGWRRQARRALVAVVVLVVVLVAMSRVYLGVHWLTDVLGSVLIGGLFLLAVDVLLARLHRRSRPAEATAVLTP